MAVTCVPWGSTAAGEPVRRWTVTSPSGWWATFLDHGARWVGWREPDGHELLLGYPTLDAVEADTGFIGAIAGRYAGRIAHGSFRLGDKRYQIPVNDKGHALHGGPQGTWRRIWQGEPIQDGDQVGVRFHLTSEDGDQGFPGRLEIQCSYLVRDAEVEILLSATTDAPTPVNLTSHAYFQLDGEQGVRDEWLMVVADAVLAIQPDGIPTGELWDVAGTDFDYRAGRRLGWAVESADPRLQAQRGLDHTYVLTQPGLAAQLTSADGSRVLSVSTDQPGLQVYLSQWLQPQTGFQPYRAVCLEAQQFPDAPNHPNFPDTIITPTRPYHSRTLYRVDPA